VEKYCQITDEAKTLLKVAVQELGFSARAYHKSLKVARTIADIEEKPKQPRSNLATTMAYVLDDSLFDYQAALHGDGERRPGNGGRGGHAPVAAQTAISMRIPGWGS